MDNIKVLLVEDEATLAMIVKDTLDALDFSIDLAYDGVEGLRRCLETTYDVVVADVMLPRMDGFDMVRRLRRHGSAVPVLFLTARSATPDVVTGFEAGANDYLKKPFAMQELIVRLRALSGRLHRDAVPHHQRWLDVGRYALSPVTQQLAFEGTTAELSHRESELLRRLIEHKDDVVSSRDILLQLWGDDTFFNNRSLHVFITKLRHKLSQDARIRIINVRGIGYKLVVEAQ